MEGLAGNAGSTARGAPYSRLNRNAEKLRRAQQSWRDRRDNLLRKANRREEELGKPVADAIENILKEIQRELTMAQHPIYPMKCVRRSCPWDTNQCPAPNERVEPARIIENNCRCVEFTPAWNGPLQ